MHELEVLLSPAEEEGGHVVSEERVARYPRWLAQAGVAVAPYIPSYFHKATSGSGSLCMAEDPSVPVFIAEAPIKALSLWSNGYAAIAMAGVEAGFIDQGKKLKSEAAPQAHRELSRIEWRGRLVYIVYDASIWNNVGVARGAAKLAAALRAEGADVRLVLLPLHYPQDARREVLELGLSAEVADREEIEVRLDQAGESYAGTVKANGDQGPDDYLSRWRRFARALNLDDPQTVRPGALPGTGRPSRARGPLKRMSLVTSAPSTKEATALAARDLMARLPHQALLSHGGEADLEATAKATGAGKKALKEAAGKFEQQQAEAAREQEPGWMDRL